MVEKLDEKWRPRTLDEVCGQSYAVMMLKDFADNPHSQGFIFSGDTGLGKTSCAYALARELGVDLGWDFLEISSGEANDAAVTMALKMMRQVGVRNGWKLILVDEADMATPKAKALWLSNLEPLPPKSVVIFTTNNVEKLDQRFIDRCEHIKFERNAKVLIPDAQAYLNRIWIGEGLHGNPPNIEDCKGVIVSAAMSFRRIARFVESEMRKQSSKIQSAAVSTTISLSQHHASKGVRL